MDIPNIEVGTRLLSEKPEGIKGKAATSELSAEQYGMNNPISHCPSGSQFY
jgi:hypothetical protein